MKAAYDVVNDDLAIAFKRKGKDGTTSRLAEEFENAHEQLIVLCELKNIPTPDLNRRNLRQFILRY